jgi:hypothetical protein
VAVYRFVATATLNETECYPTNARKAGRA